MTRRSGKTAATEAIMAILAEHTPKYGTMASPGHWSYEAKHRGEGDWFAHCSGGSGWTAEKGCGWSSEPTNYATREEALVAAQAHLAEQLEAALAPGILQIPAQAWERGWAAAQQSSWTAPTPEENPYRT